ncbi:DUF1014-domain-containing protein [Flagelloscypha sp. PMI_526]|nr:DUF1014-domain-containing protein [Flagelloscypha sp. PMI_526]
MPPKGGNAKKESGRAKKAENEAKKQQAAASEAERKEAAKWSDGSKGKGAKDEKAEKRAAELARKEENARLLAAEEASVPTKPKAAPKASGKKKATAPTPAGPGAIAAGGGLGGGKGKEKAKEDEVESFAATGIDDVIDLMETVTAKMDKASLGNQAAKAVDSHPERRFKAALEAYTENELPNIRKEYPGLRLNQYKEKLYQQFQKSPENPFNQTTVSYDASKEEKVAALNAKRAQTEERLKEKGRQL